MSRSVDLFIRSDQPVGEVAAELGQLMEKPVTEESATGTWYLRDGTVQVALAEHPFVDDRDLLLSTYRYALSARVDASHRVADTPETALLRRVADRIQRGPGWPVLLVLDLQYRDRAADAGADGVDGATAGPTADGPDPGTATTPAE